MKSTAKAIALARDLGDKLAIRFPAAAAGLSFVRHSFDSAGWPMLFLSHAGTESEGSPVILIRIIGVDAGSPDIFGSSTFAYAPHLLQFAFELTATANKPWPLLSDIAIASAESIKTGVEFELFEIASGTAVTEASLNAAVAAGAPAADIDELYFPTKGV